MNLYKVTSKEKYVSRSEFILATSETIALCKYDELYPNRSRLGEMQTAFICKRDMIIPTVEPAEEEIM